MLLPLAVITAGVALRQIDRVHFSRRRPRAAGADELIALQRTRANNLTPLSLLTGQWVQIAGWWILATHGPLLAATAAVGVAVQFRHLQEISHFAVHGVLARTGHANHLLAETFAHHPLALGPLPERRRRHVREHHPNATLAHDPNLAELRRAGLRPGATGSRYALALIHPLTPRGFHATATGIAASLRGSSAWLRCLAPAAVTAAAYLTGGWTALVCGLLIPRLLLYPQLAWMSLLVEHTWFDPEHRTGSPAHVEAGRCLRLYPRSRALAALAATTWLPYGDLHHYAHSAHPSVRWNYLPALEAHLTPPHFTPDGLLIGTATVARRHHRALTPPPTRQPSTPTPF
ncbi:fatty acid desaturase [Streptomyces sp. DSM 44917]|uniref:Fatty acid desaturase n=1 Tax=Streptomyces boetiae TaxID=3075541 RepID=A0ABU2LFV1_9ACTN|nr:fatty acid desaturase [Streptomyces sp. DSM 44917]MDT0310464.1 fatty acid desaturase [Streptomyces sp. DSM 44917]